MREDLPKAPREIPMPSVKPPKSSLEKAKELIHNAIENSPRVNITLKNGTQINNVLIYKSQRLYDSVAATKEEVSRLLNGEIHNQSFYIGNDYIQGGISSILHIKNYEFVGEVTNKSGN